MNSYKDFYQPIISNYSAIYAKGGAKKIKTRKYKTNRRRKLGGSRKLGTKRRRINYY
jgi:hypothetical protein